MIKKSFLSLLLVGWSMFVFGQEFEVIGMEVKPSDQSAQIHQRNDANGSLCGMLRVLLNEPDVKFEGSYVVGESEFFTAGYNLYLAAGAKKFTIKHENYFPLEIVLQNYGIKSVESGAHCASILPSLRKAQLFNSIWPKPSIVNLAIVIPPNYLT